MVLLFSCNFEKEKKHQIYIHETLVPHFQEWQFECLRRGLNPKDLTNHIDSILFDEELDDKYLGRCVNNRAVIRVNGNLKCEWYKIRLILFHELGHCALNRKHICFSPSIMNPAFNVQKDDDGFYAKEWPFLLNDYFANKGQPCPRILPFFTIGKICSQ